MSIWVLVFAEFFTGNASGLGAHVEIRELATYSSQAACERSRALHEPQPTLAWSCIEVRP